MTARRDARRRSPNLTEDIIREVVDILDGWAEPPLIWAALVDRARQRLGATYTRQALHRHPRIAEAFARRRLELASQPVTRRVRGSIELQKARETIARLQAKVERLEAENSNLIERFVTWAYNANARGVSEDQLNRPLPSSARR